MALDPLATVEDLEARLGRDLTEAEETRAEALLIDAAALVRGYTRQDFDVVTDEEIVLRPVGTLLRLPQRPVTGVGSIKAIGGNGVSDAALAGWHWDGADLVNIDGISSSTFVSLPGWWDDADAGARSYRVTYSHGYEEVPADVVAVVAGMVLRVLTSPALTEGLVSEQIGQYSYQMQQSSGAAGTSVRLTPADKDALTNYRRKATTIAITAH